MALIPYPDLDGLTQDARDILAIAPQNITRMLSGSGELFLPLMKFATAFFSRGALAPALRELVTCRIGHRYNARYMLDQHDIMARAAGVTDAQMTALEGPLPSSLFSEDENAALMLVDAQIDDVRPAEGLVLRVYELLGATALHELLLVAGFYHLSARYTEALRIDLDASERGNALEGMDRLAESGKAGSASTNIAGDVAGGRAI